MASEITFELDFELSGLNNLCSSASLASILLEKPFIPRRRTKWTCRSACSYLAADKNGDPVSRGRRFSPMRGGPWVWYQVSGLRLVTRCGIHWIRGPGVWISVKIKVVNVCGALARALFCPTGPNQVNLCIS